MTGRVAPLSGLKTRAVKDGVRFQVRVLPRSSRREVQGVTDEGVLRVRLTAPPAEGRANAQLIEVLSKALGVGKSAIKIVKGASSRNKTVQFSGPWPP